MLTLLNHGEHEAPSCSEGVGEVEHFDRKVAVYGIFRALKHVLKVGSGEHFRYVSLESTGFIRFAVS